MSMGNRGVMGKNTLSSRLANNQVSKGNQSNDYIQNTKGKYNGFDHKEVRKKKNNNSIKSPKKEQVKQMKPAYSLREIQTAKPKQKTSNIQNVTNTDIDDLLEMQELAEMQKAYKEEMRARNVQKVLRTILVCACVYMVFLIYGVFVTTYHYNSNGEIEPQKISAKELKELKEFEKILIEYEQCRDIYEKVLLLDYRATSGTIDPMTLGPEYSNLEKKEIQALITKVKGAKVDSKYTDINSLVFSWLNDCASVYVSNEAKYLETGQDDYLTAASSAQAIMYNTFINLTQNVVSIGETVPGADMTEIKEWDPQEYVDKTIRNQGGR